MDVIQLLKKDHKMVKTLFQECEKLKGNARQKKADLFMQIKQALTVHASVEEELVYPAFKENRSMKAQVCEALEEHHVTKMLLAELDNLNPDDEQYDAKMKVLYEYLMHHVKEEEKEMFPQAQKHFSAKRLLALGEEVEACRNELLEGREGDQKRKERSDMEDMDEVEQREAGERRLHQRSKQKAA